MALVTPALALALALALVLVLMLTLALVYPWLSSWEETRKRCALRAQHRRYKLQMLALLLLGAAATVFSLSGLGGLAANEMRGTGFNCPCETGAPSRRVDACDGADLFITSGRSTHLEGAGSDPVVVGEIGRELERVTIMSSWEYSEGTPTNWNVSSAKDCKTIQAKVPRWAYDDFWTRETNLNTGSSSMLSAIPVGQSGNPTGSTRVTRASTRRLSRLHTMVRARALLPCLICFRSTRPVTAWRSVS